MGAESQGCRAENGLLENKTGRDAPRSKDVGRFAPRSRHVGRSQRPVRNSRVRPGQLSADASAPASAPAPPTFSRMRADLPERARR